MATTTTDRKPTWVELDHQIEMALEQFKDISATITYLWKESPDVVLLDNQAFKALDTASSTLHKAWHEFVLAHGAFRRVMALQDSEAAYKCLMHDLHNAEPKVV
jgi:hypothetical protein